jgi:ATP-binding cassette, subfamily B (MDR/TAP), member 1
MLMGSSAMGLVAPSIPSFLKAAAAAQQVLKLLEQDPTIGNSNNQESPLKPGSIKWHLKLQNVTFSYPERPTVTILDELSLDIPAGKVTAVVGHSGSGKSTIIGLLERWYSPDNGSVCLDGTDIKQLDVNWLRGQMGLVQQV